MDGATLAAAILSLPWSQRWRLSCRRAARHASTRWPPSAANKRCFLVGVILPAAGFQPALGRHYVLHMSQRSPGDPHPIWQRLPH